MTLCLGARDEELLLFLYQAGYAHTGQIAAACFASVSDENRRRAAQRRLKQMVDSDLLRAIEQPIYHRARTGTKPFIYALGPRAAEIVAQRLGLNAHTVDWRPKARERNLTYMEHTLGIVDYWLALRRAVAQMGATLEYWETDRTLQKAPDRVQVSGHDGVTQTFGLVADAYFALRLRGGVRRLFLEYDRATVVLDATAASAKSWRRKVCGYLALADSGQLKARYHADGLWVAVVTRSYQRLANMVQVTEQAAGRRAHHFWFTTEDQLQHNILGDALWQVAGKPGQRYAILDE